MRKLQRSNEKKSFVDIMRRSKLVLQINQNIRTEKLIQKPVLRKSSENVE